MKQNLEAFKGTTEYRFLRESNMKILGYSNMSRGIWHTLPKLQTLTMNANFWGYYDNLTDCKGHKLRAGMAL